VPITVPGVVSLPAIVAAFVACSVGATNSFASPKSSSFT
jgi:hypothetical protein